MKRILKLLQKFNLKNSVENEIRLSRPKVGFKTDYKGSRTAAIHLFCISCMGGSRADVVSCKAFSCPLWQFRPGKKRGERPEGIPSQEQYKELLSKLSTEKRKAAGKKLNDNPEQSKE